MKKAIIHIYYIAALMAAIAISSCTRNDGDIGPWFGTWRIESISIDGTARPDYAPPYLFAKFQSSIIQFIEPDDTEHIALCYTGTWTQDDDRLLLDFTWGLSTPPAVTGLPCEATLDILKLTGREIRLAYHADDGSVITYILKKWG